MSVVEPAQRIFGAGINYASGSRVLVCDSCGGSCYATPAAFAFLDGETPPDLILCLVCCNVMLDAEKDRGGARTALQVVPKLSPEAKATIRERLMQRRDLS